MSDTDTNELASPPGWDPSEWFDASPSPSREETVTVKGKIRTATYHKDKEVLAVAIKTPDGNVRTGYLPKSIFKFSGKNYMDLPREETDRQMQVTADLFNRAKGRTITLEMFKPQY